MPADPIQIVRSRDRLKRVRGGRDGLYPFLEHNTWDIVHWFDDFLGDEIQGSGATPGLYEVVTGVDGALAILANQENGVAELSASVGAGAGDEYCGLSLPELAWTGERNAVIAVRVNLDAVTNVKLEIGFTDVTTDVGVIDVLATPTLVNAGTDAAIWIIDTTDTLNWQIVATQAGTLTAKTEPGVAPVAGTFETMIVALHGTNAKFMRLNAAGGEVYRSDWVTSAITAADALVPWIFIQERTGVDRNARIDFIDVRARRTT